MRKKLSIITLLILSLTLTAQYPYPSSSSGMANYAKMSGGTFPSGFGSSGRAMDNSIALPEPVRDSTYIVGPGDQFRISLVGSIVDEVIEASVDPEGNMLIPKFGFISALNLLVKVRQDIIELIKSKTKNVEVSVQLEKTKTIQIDISGQLFISGAHALDGIARLSDVVIKANDNKSDLPGHLSFRNIKIIRRDKSIVVADLHNFLLNGAVESNPYLFSGDRVIVEQRKYNVLVTGAVARSWSCEWKNETLYDLIQFSGGLTGSADSTIRVNRFKADKSGVETFTFKYPDDCKNFQILPEDNVIAGTNPKWRNGITVSLNGRVKNPGVYTLPKESTIKDFVALAGGLLDDADTVAAYLQRPAIVNNFGTAVYRQHLNDMDVQTAMTQSSEENILQMTQSSVLQDGDIISVPKKVVSVSVVGKVVRPGMLPFTPGEEWKHYVKLAGGFDKNSYGRYAKVYKRRNNGWVSAVDAGMIEAGDIIMVPELPAGYQWNKFKDIVALTSGVLGVAGTITSLIILSTQ
jgi:protein involved in polysaccharide export with SLBB domain